LRTLAPASQSLSQSIIITLQFLLQSHRDRIVITAQTHCDRVAIAFRCLLFFSLFYFFFLHFSN
jgi:hypothetical protein